MNVTQFIWKLLYHVSGGTTTHHQERKQLYIQHLVFVTPLLLLAALKHLVFVTPLLLPVALQHPVFVTPLLLPAAIVAGSSNGVTNTRCCRYSCLRS